MSLKADDIYTVCMYCGRIKHDGQYLKKEDAYALNGEDYYKKRYPSHGMCLKCYRINQRNEDENR